MTEDMGITAASTPIFVGIAGGALGVIRRPRLRALPRLKEAGATTS
ncbi:MAG TPA: hypothetical protein VFD36_29145 [Kofleriaceae bacterium]|nr:hypothetical protein [Kofleriaceae bacterium]